MRTIINSSKRTNHAWFKVSIALLACLSFLVTPSCQKDEFDQDPTSDTDMISFAVSSKKANPRVIKDYEGNVYKIVKIGRQWWMAENLKTAYYNNGDEIPNVTDKPAWAALSTGAFCDHSNNPDNSTTYGKLYNYYAVADERKLCPAGWHVPTDGEWTTLATFLGGESVAGGKLKEEGTTHWWSPNTVATNQVGFTALPGSMRNYDGTYFYLGETGVWWSSTELTYPSGTFPFTRGVIYNTTTAGKGTGYKPCGLGIRCLKDR